MLIKKNDNNGFKGEHPGVGAAAYAGSSRSPGDAHSLQRPEVASPLWVGVYQLFGSIWCRQGIACCTSEGLLGVQGWGSSRK